MKFKIKLALNKIKKKTVTAHFPCGIGSVEISPERAAQIKRLQKSIREQRAKKVANNHS